MRFAVKSPSFTDCRVARVVMVVVSSVLVSLLLVFISLR